MGEKIIVKNRRAGRDYHVLDRFEAGIELQGTEVKSLRAGHMTLKDSYANVEEGELFLIGSHISPYEQGNIYNHDPERTRRLLMHKREILKLGAQVAEKGLTLVPPFRLLQTGARQSRDWTVPRQALRGQTANDTRTRHPTRCRAGAARRAARLAKSLERRAVETL